ncbi:MAG: replication factor C large subunit [Candidatus Woesearchaeota archaeon]|nr:replication factor C large subunit [Candidatus Woesearchaeota archaeon]
MEPWTKKYQPKKAEELVGQKNVYEKVRSYVQQFKGKKPLLLAGQPGVGKTTVAYVAAAELDLELLEINASDTRNKKSIELLIGAAAKQQSLFFKGRIILVDEVDGVSGVKDRGGVVTLVKLIKESGHPMIFIANDIENKKLKPLRKVCEVVQVEAPAVNDVVAFLEYVAKQEGVVVTKDTCTAIVRRNAGDIRASLNDLQSLGQDIDVSLLGEREHVEEMQHALLRVFKTTSADVALPAFDNVSENVDKILLWIDENLPREYTKAKDLERGLDALAEADKFFGRIRRWQYYRFYVYIYNLLSAGIALAKDEKYPGMTKYVETKRLLKIWIYNQKNFKRKRLAEQLAPQLHTSSKRVQQEILPFLKLLYKHNPAVLENYDLDEDAIAWLAK